MRWLELTGRLPVLQGLNNAVALDFHYAEQMIYWTDVTTQGSMIRRMRMNGSNMEVSGGSGASLCNTVDTLNKQTAGAACTTKLWL